MSDSRTLAISEHQAPWVYYHDYLAGAPVWNAGHECIGRVTKVLLDEAGEPEYVAVRTNGLRARSRLMPLVGARFGGVRLVVSHSRRLVLDAPVYAEPELAPATRDLLRRHYDTAA